MTIKAKLHDGMWDHGCLINRPRYFRHFLSCMTTICVIFVIPIFATAIASIAIQTEYRTPLYYRYSLRENDPVPDAAIYFSKDSSSLIADATIDLHVCGGDGRAEYRCNCCDCESKSGDAEFDQDYYFRSPKGLTNFSKNNNNNNKNRHDRDQQQKNKTCDDISSAEEVFLSTSSDETSRIARRRSSISVDDNPNCECGAEIMMDGPKCPPTNLSAVFPGANSTTNCKKFLDAIRDVFLFNTIWVILGMAGTFTGWLLYCFVLRTVTQSEKYRYLSPFLAQLWCIIFGLGVHAAMFGCCLGVVLTSGDLFATRDDRIQRTEINFCGEGPRNFLYHHNFQDHNIFRIWQAALAGAVFSSIPTVACFFGLLCTCIVPSPSDFDGDYKLSICHESNHRSSEIWYCFWTHFPDYESQPPANGASVILKKGDGDREELDDVRKNTGAYGKSTYPVFSFDDSAPTTTSSSKSPQNHHERNDDQQFSSNPFSML